LSGPEDDGVVQLLSQTSRGTSWWCSGTLIAPNLVLTARHCITAYQEGSFSCDSEGNLVSGPGGSMGALDDPAKIAIHAGTATLPKTVAHGLQIFAPQTTSICRNDIAIVMLDKPLTGIPIFPIRALTGIEPGEQVRLVGYGTDDDGGFSIRHTRIGLAVSKVGSNPFRPVGDPIPNRTFMTVGPTLCIGDSGGPALSDQGALVGVFSQFDGLCTSPNAKDFFTLVAPFMNDLIVPAFAAAGYEPWLEGNSEPGLPPETGGASGTGGNASTGGAANGGAASTNDLGGAPSATGGNTAGPAVYDQGPAKGGDCSCRAAGSGRYTGFGALIGLAIVLGLRKRRVSHPTKS